jgi:eukaryotic-like serine/threonine-protein kinase
MGAVYKAEHPTLNRLVIIKKLTLTHSADFVERFKREARIMMDFRNEHIVQVFDHFKEGNAFHIVMEFVDGVTLEHLITTRRFIPNQVALVLFHQICSALKYAHDQNVLHRDVKPANILISRDGVVKLVDFGVSTTLDAGNEDGLTKAGMTIGTPSYLAPEQIANARNRDKRSDIYAAGVILYEMVVGHRPFQGGFTPQNVAQIEKGQYVRPRKINPTILPIIQRIIRRAMHHKVKKRYQDFGQIIIKLSGYLRHYRDQDAINAAIRRYLENNDDLERKPRWWTPKRLLRKKPLTALMVAIIITAVGAALGWLRYEGVFYGWLYPDEYGALRLSLNLREGHKSIDEHFISATLFKDEDSRLSQERSIRFDFRVNPVPEAKASSTVTTQTVYLPSRRYMILLYSENEQYRENFYLYPLSMQTKKSGIGHPQTISWSLRPPPNLPVTLQHELVDFHSGQPIVDPDTAIFIDHQNRWVSWEQFRQDPTLTNSLISGRRYHFRFQRDGYLTQNRFVTIQPEQTTVTMRIRLMPIPGEIRLRSRTEKALLPLINNSNRYLSGGENPQWRLTTPLSAEYQSIHLPPGDVFLTIVHRRFLRDNITKTRKISVLSGQKISLDIDFDLDTSSIRLDIP